MNIIGCGSIPTLTVSFTIGKLENEQGQVVITEMHGDQSGFWTMISKSSAKKLKIGDNITVVCVPSSDISFATETLAIVLHRSEKESIVIFDRNHYWENIPSKKK